MEIDINRNTTLAFKLVAINPSAFGGIVFKGATPEHFGFVHCSSFLTMDLASAAQSGNLQAVRRRVQE